MSGARRLSLDVTLLRPTAQFGVALHVDDDFAEGYYINVEVARNRMEFKSTVRMTEYGGKMFPYEVEIERPLPPNDGRHFHLEVLVEGTVLEVYLNDSVALGSRMYDRVGGCFGLFVADGAARFEAVQLYGE